MGIRKQHRYIKKLQGGVKLYTSQGNDTYGKTLYNLRNFDKLRKISPTGELKQFANSITNIENEQEIYIYIKTHWHNPNNVYKI